MCFTYISCDDVGRRQKEKMHFVGLNCIMSDISPPMPPPGLINFGLINFVVFPPGCGYSVADF